MHRVRGRWWGDVGARPARFALVGCLVALGWTLGWAAGVPGIAAAGAAPRSVTVDTAQHWTDTLVDVEPGQPVEVSASGTIRYAPGRGNTTGPQGIPWGAACTRVLHAPTGPGGWAAPGINCWSLIGRIGNGRPFFIGAHATFKPPRAGRLFLGINDDYFSDNKGSWHASVQPVTATGPQTGAGTGGADKSSSSMGIVLAVIAVVVLAGVVVAALLFARRRRRGPASPRPAPVPVAAAAAGLEEAPSLEEEVVLPAMPTDDDQTVVPDETDVAHVNIFQVGLGASVLRIGYNHFPESVLVSWRITQGLATRSTGSFVTNGGGETEHYVSFPVDVAPGEENNDTTVHFRWIINDVPFTYSARPSAAGVTSAD